MSTNIQIAPRRRRNNKRRATVVLPATNGSRTQNNRLRRKRQRARKRAANTINNNLNRAGIDTKIAKCTVEYAQALVNPFGARQTMPCVPDSIVMPSLKFQSKVRGTAFTGVNGAGYVLFDPWHMMWNDGNIAGTSTSAPIIFTGVENTAASQLSAVIAGGVFTNPGVFIANSNSPYTQDDYNANGRQVRLVAAGLRITYTGSNFRNQGQVYLGRSQSNASFPNNLPFSDFAQDNYTSIVPVSRKSEYTFYTPDTHDFLSYHNAEEFDAHDGGEDHFAYLIAIDGGDTAEPQAWFFEAVAYFEVIGKGLTLSPSHSDVQGLGHVHEALPVRNPTQPPKTVETSTFQKIANSLSSSFVSVLPQLTRAGMGMAAGYLTGNPGMAMQGLSNAFQSQVTISEVD